MEVTVLIPRHVDDPIPSLASTCDDTVVITLHVAQSRIVWRELVPCLFQKRGRQQRQRHQQHRVVAQRNMLLCLLSHFYFNNIPTSTAKNNNNNNNMTMINQQEQSLTVAEEGDLEKMNDDEFALLRQRRIRLGQKLLNHFQSSSSFSSFSYNPSKKQLILFIQPPKIMTPHFEYYWEKILIHLEHRLILAQSLAGLYSTLGGGCFMTRRMSTAIVLAQQQQRMALILNDMDMYYKSQINAAYNFIYIGQFQAARTLLRQVRNAVMAQQMISSDKSRKHTLVLLRDTKKNEESSSSSSCLEDISNGNRQVRNSSSSRDKDNAQYRSAIVLLRMCRAARVLAKRVEKAAAGAGHHLGGGENNTVPPLHKKNAAAAVLPSLSSTPPSKTVDDYARIRLVQDQSTNKDLLGLI